MVVNLKRECYDVYIGRGSPFGNPYTHLRGATRAEFKVASREEAIERYREYFLNRVEHDPVFREQVLALRGKRLGCYCKPLPCHGDIIVGWLNANN